MRVLFPLGLGEQQGSGVHGDGGGGGGGGQGQSHCGGRRMGDGQIWTVTPQQALGVHGTIALVGSAVMTAAPRMLMTRAGARASSRVVTTTTASEESLNPRSLQAQMGRGKFVL